MMFRYITVLAFSKAVCSTYAKGSDIENVDKKDMVKRHGGYVLDVGLIKFLAGLQAERIQQKKKLDDIEKLVRDFIFKKGKSYKSKYMIRENGRRFDDIRKQVETTKKLVSALDLKCTSLKNQIVLINNQKASPTVAFYAWLSNGNTKRNTIIKYNQVTTNIGNGYNANTGKFVAPVSGIYMFAITVSTYRGDYAHLNIIKNGRSIGVARSETSKDLDSGTKVVVLKLMASDILYVYQQTSYSLWTDPPYAFNTFSGFLIKQIPS